MKKEKSTNNKTDFKIMNEVLDILRHRSASAITIARKELLAMNLKGEGAEALMYYAAEWDDTSHPGMLSLTCEAVGGRPEKAVPFQVATLILTAAMDVHDDIIDRSRTKNGRTTLFGRFGKDVALLVGDALWLKGFMLLDELEGDFSREIRKATTSVIKRNFRDVGNAHVLELALRGKLDVSPSEYFRILRMKASNISLHAAIGAIVGGGSPEEIGSLEKCGRILGMLVTLREEFIDVFEPEELRNRARNECLPLPLLYAMEDVDSRKLVLRILSKTEISEKNAERIVKVVFDSKKTQMLKRRMEKWSKEALQIVAGFPRSNATTALSKLILGTLEDL